MPFGVSPFHIKAVTESLFQPPLEGQKWAEANVLHPLFTYNLYWMKNPGPENIAEYGKFFGTCFERDLEHRQEPLFHDPLPALRARMLNDWFAQLRMAVEIHMRKRNNNDPAQEALDARFIAATKFLIEKYGRWQPRDSKPPKLMPEEIRRMVKRAGSWQPGKSKYDCEWHWVHCHEKSREW